MSNHKNPMYKIHDEADQFRIELSERFAGEGVAEVARKWREALAEPGSRTFTVDISSLKDYDVAGAKLLREMYRHGTQVAARNAEALRFLSEISALPRRGPALVHRADGKLGVGAPVLGLRVAAGQ